MSVDTTWKVLHILHIIFSMRYFYRNPNVSLPLYGNETHFHVSV